MAGNWVDDTEQDEVPMRAPCSACGWSIGYVTETNGQDVIRCCRCNRWAYNRPKAESGKPQRSVRTRPEIKPSTKARILERDNYTCVMCHATDKPLRVGHLLSVEDGKRLGASIPELFSDENLAAMCEECNLGQSATTISLRLMCQILQARNRRAEAAELFE